MKKVVFIVVFIAILVSSFIIFKLELVMASTINLKLEVFIGNRGHSETMIAGTTSVGTISSLPFNVPSNIAVRGDTDYKLTISNLTPNKILNIYQWKWENNNWSEPNVQTTTPSSDTLEILGTFNDPVSSPYELWAIQVVQNQNSSPYLYLFLVKNEHPKNQKSCAEDVRMCQYYIPDITIKSPNLGGEREITHYVYWNKTYCPTNLETTATITSAQIAVEKVDIEKLTTNRNISIRIVNNEPGFYLTLGRIKSYLKNALYNIWLSSIISGQLSNIAKLFILPFEAPVEPPAQVPARPQVQPPVQQQPGVALPIPEGKYECYYGFCYYCQEGAKPPSINCSVTSTQYCPGQCRIQIRE